MPHVELGAEPGVPLRQLEVGDRPRHRVPVDVAYRRVDAADELGPADPQVAEVDAVEEQRDWARAQGAQVLEGLLGSVQEAEVGHGRIIPDPESAPSLSAKRGFSTTSGFARFFGTRPAATSISDRQACSTQPRSSSSV